jgi:hypothetical protein
MGGRVTTALLIALAGCATSTEDRSPDSAAQSDGGGAQDSSGDDTGPGSPERSAYRIKAIQPDFWPMDELVDSNVGGAAMNLVWYAWEPERVAPPCSAGAEEYDGHCFAIDAATDEAIAAWTERGVIVTAVVYGVPGWARTTRPCSPVAPGFEVFCAPDDAEDYGRFAGMLASRYDGLHGHGRIAEFVIHNEVNANDWFDIGCGQGVPCDPEAWIQVYADNYDAAYDRITAAQPSAKVLISLEHAFGAELDNPSSNTPLLSGMTFLTGFAARVGDRAWRVAYHPYPPDLRSPSFSADDYPFVTYGNIGVLVGWLRRTFPEVPSAWTVELTESGINSLSPSSPGAQALAVCASFINVLGTPGIDNYVYHRMVDHPAETAAGLALGLRDVDGNAKPAWDVWAMANRSDLDPPQLSCGFEDLPYTRLRRSYSPARGHWVSSRMAPPGFAEERAWKLLREPADGTAPLYECRAGSHNLLSTDAGCEGLLPLGPVGHAFTAPGDGRVALYRCAAGGGADHFVTTDAGCEGATPEGVLGYAIP